MKRNIDINEISDGQLYDSDSLVKISCNDCDGCEKCCHNMGESIILDPFDIWQLTKITGKGFEQLLDNEIKLSVVDGIILPHINMDDDGESCKFLKNGKCSIHIARPGFCRLFPLGRIYDDEGTFKYFNQIYECDYKNKSKIKIKKWIGLSHLSKYEEYICNWHRILKNLENSFEENKDNEEFVKAVTMKFINTFFINEYKSELIFENERNDLAFYKEFEERCNKIGISF